MRSTFRMPDALDVDAAVEALRRVGPVVALESATRRPGLGQRSFVAGAPRAVAELRGGRWRVTTNDHESADLSRAMDAARSPFHALQTLLQHLAAGAGSTVRAFGFFGYECVAGPAPERGRPHPADPPRAGPPDAWFLIPDCVVEWPGTATPLLHAVDRRFQDRLRPRPGPREQTGSGRPAPEACFLPDDRDLASYARVFHAAREELRLGNSYQLCLTYALQRSFDGDPLHLYRALRACSPAPFAGYLEAGPLALVSSSPERFLRVGADRHVEARPMKGTARRTGDPERDRAIREALVASVKDRAENLMIADLLRNDLGRVCRLGSVRASARAALEEYATVYQLVSCIEGDLGDGHDVADLLEAAFPPGSMTGAPKVRSMEILRRLEAQRRGPYSGILGHWGSDGTADFNVLIRTWVVHGGQASAGVGGGIVWDSSVEGEFAETRVKAAAMLQALARTAEPRRRERAAP